MSRKTPKRTKYAYTGPKPLHNSYTSSSDAPKNPHAAAASQVGRSGEAGEDVIKRRRGWWARAGLPRQQGQQLLVLALSTPREELWGMTNLPQAKWPPPKQLGI